MDLSAEVDRAAEELEWGELASTLEAAIYNLLAETPTTPPPTISPPPPVPAELNADPQPPLGQGGPHGGYLPLGADPYMMAAPTINQAPLYPDDFLQPDQLYSQGEAYSQGQHLPYQWPVHNMVTAAAVGDPAASSYPYEDSPMFTLNGDVEQNLHPVALLDGDVLYEMPAEFYAPPNSVPPVDTSNSKKRKRHSQQDEDIRPYIKKPPNAFMLFMKEHRPDVEENIKTKGNAAVNVVLGQRWKSLTQEEQASYYKQADNERLLHAQKHPEWSSKDNYGKKRKRGSRKKTPPMAEAPEEDWQPAKRLCVATTPHTRVMQTVPAQTHTALNMPVWDTYHLPQVHEVGPASYPDAAGTASPCLVLPAPLPQAPADWRPEESLQELLEELELYPQTTQPQFPCFPHFDLSTVDLRQISEYM